MISPDILGPMAASFAAGAGTIGAVVYRKLSKVDEIYRMLAGYDERDGDGLIDQVERTHDMAIEHREALREEDLI